MTFTTGPNDQPRDNANSHAGSAGEQSGVKRRRNRRRRPQTRQTHSESSAGSLKQRPAQRAAGGVDKRAQSTSSGSQDDKPTSTSRRRSSNRGRSRTTGSKKNSQRNNNRNAARSSYAEAKMPTRTETSAGGLVISGMAEAVQEDGSVDLSQIYVALIGRLDRRGRLLWSMPKGHVEDDEDIAATAEREVWEETGIYGEVIAKLGVIDYWFVSDGTRIHKTVHHHLLRYIDGQLNDEDPEVTEVSWIPASALIEHFAYADERKLARVAHVTMPEYARKELAEGRTTPR